jgi:hypothetical protein
MLSFGRVPLVRFVDQKPNLSEVWGTGPKLKRGDSLEPENLIPVSVEFRPPLVRG